MKNSLVVLFSLLPLLPGCTVLGGQSYKHVIEDKTGSTGADGIDHRVGTLALVAERRMALVKFSDGTFCSEPPPDAVDSLSSAVTAALSGQSTHTSSLSANATASLSSYAKQLFYRSQGLQLYRDGAFALCTLSLNRKISNEVLVAEFDKLLTITSNLIAAEIPELKSIKADSGTTTAVQYLPQAASVPSPPSPAASS